MISYFLFIFISKRWCTNIAVSTSKTDIFNSSEKKILDRKPLFFLENYTEALNFLKNLGKPLAGYFTNRVPVEIIHTLELLPVRMLSLGSFNQGTSEKFIQIFGCSWLRQLLDIGLAKGFEDIDCMVFSAGTCDSLQNVSDIWRKIFPEQFAYNLTFPVLINTEASVKYFQSEIEALIRDLSSQFTDNGMDLEIDPSIDLYNTKRAYLQELAGIVSERKMSYRVFAKILLLADIAPVEAVNTYLESQLIDLKASPQTDIPESPRLLLVGGMFDNYRLWEIPEIDHIVADDMSFGTRNFNFQVPKGSIQGYAKAYMERIPDPTAYDMDRRLNGLKNMIKNHRVDGAVLLGMKWCDPDAFEFVPIQNILKEQGIPNLKLETSPDLSNLQQMQTRLSAFIEMLS
ncbi:MAG: 2-hydroxyacyl-CoA dehydratase subunit D [Candidatus Odinarchaeota archaeon]